MEAPLLLEKKDGRREKKPEVVAAELRLDAWSAIVQCNPCGDYSDYR